MAAVAKDFAFSTLFPESCRSDAVVLKPDLLAGGIAWFVIEIIGLVRSCLESPVVID
jgi:hypothetical protein